MRPADAIETAECWEIALKEAARPSLLALSRQNLPTLRHDGDENLCARGAYVLREADGDLRVVLMATGSEVEIAVKARDILQARGIGTRVVSMPCWELFDEQPSSYRAAILPPGVVRVAVEAAGPMGWDRFIGENGGFVGMNGFGASAPAKDLYRHFGITEEAVAEAAVSRISKKG